MSHKFMPSSLPDRYVPLHLWWILNFFLHRRLNMSDTNQETVQKIAIHPGILSLSS